MFLVLGNSIEELKEGVTQIERAKASGYSCGAGGSSVEELEIVKELIEENEIDIEDVVEKPLDVFKLVTEYYR